jgi:hypothetical protein
MAEDRYCGLLVEKDLTKHQRSLGCSALEEHLIMEIAHGLVTHQYPWATLERDSDFDIRHREIKRAVALGDFDKQYPAGTKANGMTVITRQALKGALKRPYLRSADWLAGFHQRWQDATPNEGSAGTEAIKNHRGEDQGDATLAKITAVLDYGKEVKLANPRWTRAKIIRNIVASDRFAHEYGEVSIKQIIYGSYPWMRDRGMPGLPD